jgi:polyhydroxyalkanoate synthase
MASLPGHLLRSWSDGAIRVLESFRRGLTEPFPLDEDPPPVTPYEVVYEGGKVRLRHYQAAGPQQHTPLLLVYALIKRAYILDLQAGRSVIENLTRQGFEVYLTDWIPPTSSDSWRGFDAYVNGDLVNAVRAVQAQTGVERVSMLGYCFGGLLATMYTVLHPEDVENLVALTLPLDMSVRDEIPVYALFNHLGAATVDRIVDVYGNCPAWMVQLGFSSMAPLHHGLNKFVDLYRSNSRAGYEETWNLFERWMSDEVPLAGRIFRELTTDILKKNLLFQNRFEMASRKIDLGTIRCPVLNIIGELDDVVPPAASLPFTEVIGSRDKRELLFPSGHMGIAVSGAAHAQLWPEVGAWLGARSA